MIKLVLTLFLRRVERELERTNITSPTVAFVRLDRRELRELIDEVEELYLLMVLGAVPGTDVRVVLMTSGGTTIT